MKRMYILGLFFSVLLFSHQPAQAMPTFGPSFAKVDGVVVKAYNARHAGSIAATLTATPTELAMLNLSI